MNYSTAVFLINKHVRAVVATYEAGENAPRTTFKTLDPSIMAGDLVIVPTDTRHKMTVVKIVETDVDVDFDGTATMHWVIGKVDDEPYKKVLAQETSAIATIKSAELRQKRDNLRNALFKDHQETLKALPIAAINGDTPTAEQQ